MESVYVGVRLGGVSVAKTCGANGESGRGVHAEASDGVRDCVAPYADDASRFGDAHAMGKLM
jgi:hypothetical protein